MSAETKYRCDICRTEIKDTAFAKDEAYALRWASSGKLELASPWRDMPLHVCVRCVEAVVEFNAKRTKQ